MTRPPTSTSNNYFLQPYPHIQQRWAILILVPLFISFFLVVFQPFGLQRLEIEHKSLLLIGYGLVTFIIMGIDMYLLPLIFPRLFCEERWLVINELIYMVWIVLSISAGNYLYSTAFSITIWYGFQGFLIFLFFTFSIAIIPIVGIVFITQNHHLKKNLKGAQEISNLIKGQKEKTINENIITLTSTRNQAPICIDSHQLICIESDGNYLNIWHLENGKIIQNTIRNTVKTIEEQLSNTPELFRCHRAYIINLHYIEHAEGNSQGYKIHLKHLKMLIPVSRNYTKPFKQLLSTPPTPPTP